MWTKTLRLYRYAGSRRRTGAPVRRAGLKSIAELWVEGSTSTGVPGQVWAGIPVQSEGSSFINGIRDIEAGFTLPGRHLDTESLFQVITGADNIFIFKQTDAITDI